MKLERTNRVRNYAPCALARARDHGNNVVYRTISIKARKKRFSPYLENGTGTASKVCCTEL